MRKKYGPFPGSFSRRPFSQQVYPVEVRSTQLSTKKSCIEPLKVRPKYYENR
jgi:hypothetical protein